MALAGCTEWTTRSPRASQPLKIPIKRRLFTDVILFTLIDGVQPSF
jgi:hypothetical protein